MNSSTRLMANMLKHRRTSAWRCGFARGKACSRGGVFNACAFSKYTEANGMRQAMATMIHGLKSGGMAMLVSTYRMTLCTATLSTKPT